MATVACLSQCSMQSTRPTRHACVLLSPPELVELWPAHVAGLHTGRKALPDAASPLARVRHDDEHAVYVCQPSTSPVMVISP